jgi:CubicO group peptidase (beta-lactamase class C family)
VARNDDAWRPVEMLARAKADRLVYEPGKGWGYSNIGYFHVRQLIERTTKSPLGNALTDLVLRLLAIGRLLTGDLLPRYLLSSMLDRYPVDGPIAGRPWKAPRMDLA